MQRPAPEHDSPCLANTELLVVGAGPSGIAALLTATRLRMDALAIDAGSGPLASIRQYPSSLILSSPAHHYEVAGIPLDCRDPSELTREEVLAYYGRLVALGRLRVESRTECVGMQRHGAHWRVDVTTPEGPAYIRAEQVVLTSWFSRRQPASEWLDHRGRVRVVSVLRDATEVTGQAVVIVGGGLSAVEHALMVMAQGKRVTIVARHELTSWLSDPAVARLTRATGSEWVGNVRALGLDDGHVHFQSADGERSIACDVLVACLGVQLDQRALRLALEVELFAPGELASLRAACTFDEVRRRNPQLSVDEVAERAVAGWPDFRRALIDGASGVRAAGAVLHAGGAHAGVVVSLRTAELAVLRAAGERTVPVEDGPLARVLLEWARAKAAEAPAFDVVRTLRPLAVQSWSRSVPLGRIEQSAGLSEERRPSEDSGARRARDTVERACRHVTNLLRDQPQTARFLQIATGDLSLDELATRLECRTESDRSKLAASFYWLCRSNALTWLPPRAEKCAHAGGGLSLRSVPSARGEAGGAA